jgi:hypothetical protein
MDKFESKVKAIPYSQEMVYEKLSNLNHIAAIQDRLPEDKVSNLSFTADTLSFKVSPVGEISLQIVDREAPKTIKFETVKSPQPFNLWVQLLPVSEAACKMKITIKMNLNPFMRMMVKKPLTEGLEKMADVLATIPYNQ